MNNNPHATLSMKRAFLCAAIFLALLSLVTTACNQSDNQLTTSKTKASPTETQSGTAIPDEPTSNSSPTPRSTEEPTPTPEMISQINVDSEDLRGINLTFWHTWSGEAEEVLNEIIEQFNAQNEWGIQVQGINQVNLDLMHENIQAAIEEGNPPDLSMGYLYQALDWDSKHELVDLNPYIMDPEWGISKEDQSDFYPVFWDHDFSGERRVGIPIYRSGQVLYYNVSRAFELGFTAAPTTLETFEQQACAAAQAYLDDGDPDNDGTGGWIISTDYPTVMGWLNAATGGVVPSNQDNADDGYDFDNPQVQETFAFLRELYEQGCAWISENQYPDEEFASRLGLFAAGSLSGLPYQEDAFKQAGNNDQWTVIPFPSSSNEPAIYVYGPAMEVFSSSEDRQLAAWLFIKWVISSENLSRLTGVGASFPLRASSLEMLKTDSSLPPQWHAAINLLPVAHPEPAYQSWGIVRWAVSDAATQLFRSYFTSDSIPELVTFLDQTANDLHENPLKDSRAKSITATPEGTITPTGSPPAPQNTEQPTASP